MATRKVRLQFEGEEVEAEVIGVDSMNEHQNSYLLSDGTSLSMRSVVVQVARVVDRYDKEGNPVYIIKSQNVLAVSAPENLRRGQRP